MFIYTVMFCLFLLCFFFFNDTATTEIYTLSYTTLFRSAGKLAANLVFVFLVEVIVVPAAVDHDDLDQKQDRKSTRLNSSHSQISYAVFCLKKKKTNEIKSLRLKLIFTINLEDSSITIPL